MNEEYLEELKLCLKIWKKHGHCSFGGNTNCEECGAPYLMYKIITGNALHGEEMKRLVLSDWINLVEEIG